jgi:hypothetical protein
LYLHEKLKNGLAEAEWHFFPVRYQQKNIIASHEVKLESRVLVCVYCKVYKVDGKSKSKSYFKWVRKLDDDVEKENG